jgi:hypothetical protein
MLCCNLRPSRTPPPPPHLEGILSHNSPNMSIPFPCRSVLYQRARPQPLPCLRGLPDQSLVLVVFAGCVAERMLSATRRPPRNLARPRLYLQQPHQVSTYSSSATKAIFNILLFTYSLAIRTLPSGDLQHDVSLYGLAPVTRLRASMSRNVLCRLGKAQDSRALLADSCSADFANASLVCKLYQTLFCVPW